MDGSEGRWDDRQRRFIEVTGLPIVRDFVQPGDAIRNPDSLSCFPLKKRAGGDRSVGRPARAPATV